jgi:hypothetical protein
MSEGDVQAGEVQGVGGREHPSLPARHAGACRARKDLRLIESIGTCRRQETVVKLNP